MNQYSSVPGTVPDPVSSGLTASLASPLTEEERLLEILCLSGPDGAADLLGMILTDLRRLQADLTEGLTTGDAAALRSASHALIALAGTIGAPGLRDAALDLNLAARQAQGADLRPQAGTLAAGVQALCHDLTARQARLDPGSSA